MSGGPLLAVAAYAAAYAVLVLGLWRRRRVLRPWRIASFALGLAALAVALAGPLDTAADAGSLTAHMAQHELVLNVAPVLLLLGLDAQLAAPLTRAVAGPVARRSLGLRALRAAGSPALALGVYVAVMWAWQLPDVHAAASASTALHAFGHVSLLWAGALFWFHLLRPLPAVRRLSPAGQLAYLASGTAAGGVLAAVLVGAPAALYGDAFSAGVGDQRLAGALMMAVEMPLALAVATVLLMRAAARPRGTERLRWLAT